MKENKKRQKLKIIEIFQKKKYENELSRIKNEYNIIVF